MEQKFAMVALDHGTQKTDLTFLSKPVEEKVKAFLSIRKRLWPVFRKPPGNWG